MNIFITEGVWWVGHVDWNVRDFHGYRTARGSTYNAYLVKDKKIALIDTVKAPFAKTLIKNLKDLLKDDSIDYIVCNHAELDHAGSLPTIVKEFPRAEIVCDEKCRDALSLYFDISDWKFKIVSSGDRLSLGNLSLTFIETPMVHWPESMFTYIPERKLLFSMDAFGQHYASSFRFDDQEPFHVVMQEAKTYYANIVMLYSSPIARVLDKAKDLNIDIVAPSHGVIWRKHVNEIFSAYQRWVNHKVEPHVLVLYDTMWQSTARMAEAIVEGIISGGARATLMNVRTEDLTNIATESLEAAAIAVGSPTLNKTLMPQVAAALTYLKGLQPGNKAGLAFGSYGWAKGGAKAVEDILREMKLDIIREAIQCRYAPSLDVINDCHDAGRQLAQESFKRAGQKI